VISVTRLNGSEIVVNADLIETIEATPDTVITLVDGKKYVVNETTEQVVEKIRMFRAAILRRVDDPHVPTAAELYVLPGHEGK
jgi:flagellar protein FlbD